MISAIIPSYRNPAYLDLCLKSMVEGKLGDETQSEIIVVLDGYAEESQKVIERYEDKVNVLPLAKNMGMAYAINMGVYNASGEAVFILNDDNVAPRSWDADLQGIYEAAVNKIDHGRSQPSNAILSEATASIPKIMVTIEQIEPTNGIFNFRVKDFGRTPEEFRYEQFIAYEQALVSDPIISPLNFVTETKRAYESFSEKSQPKVGMIFPFMIPKHLFMTIGGFDVSFESPFWVDIDFMLKATMSDVDFYRYRGRHFYHFGSKATKNRTDSDAIMFRNSETPAAQYFYYKWQQFPRIRDLLLKWRTRS